jgi:hypothetical protein
MTTGTQDQGFTNRVVIQVQTRFLVAPLAAVTADIARQPQVDEKDGIVIQKGFH